MEQLQIRRDLAAALSANNPILALGEPVAEIPVVSGQPMRLKIGNGYSSWNDLPYHGEGGGGGVSLAANTFTGKQKAPIFSSPVALGGVVNMAVGPGTVALDLSAGDYFSLLMDGNTTLTLSNAPSLTDGEMLSFVVSVSQGTPAYSLSWWSGITWLTTGGTAPDMPISEKSKEFVFTTTDGTNFIGRAGAAN